MASGNPPLDCAVIGGGLHGTTIARRMLEETLVEHSGLAILDPHNDLLRAFRERARNCGMETMRSTFVHHLGADPFSLESFAEGNGRSYELEPTVDYPPRPTLDLFLDHAEMVLERAGLRECHLQSAVTGIEETDDGLLLDTTVGPLETRTAILAIGQAEQLCIPSWAEGVSGVEHVWGSFDRTESVDRTIVVGGGITAGQLAAELSADEQVVLCSRHPLEWEVTEADPRWINWPHIEEHLHDAPPGSAERLERISTVRNDGTMPPYLYETLKDRATAGQLFVEQGTVETTALEDPTDDEEESRVVLTLESGRRFIGDRVVLATGFDDAFDHPLVDSVAETLGLERGHRGVPVLDDDTLAWRHTDGETAPLYVSGAMAQGTVGPFAGNIPGARRSGDRICPAVAACLGDGSPAHPQSATNAAP